MDHGNNTYLCNGRTHKLAYASTMAANNCPQCRRERDEEQRRKKERMQAMNCRHGCKKNK